MRLFIRKIDNDYGIWDCNRRSFLSAVDLPSTASRIREYRKDHPFPTDSSEDCFLSYKFNDAVHDLTADSGTIVIPGTLDQAEWVADLIDWLFKKYGAVSQ